MTAPAPIPVAIDGPAGSGKSSVSRAAADRLGFGILDTGAAYRALAWAALETGADLDDEPAVLALMDDWRYSAALIGGQVVGVLLQQGDGYTTHDVTAAIREPEISAQVSRISKHPEVRVRLNDMFRRIVAESGLPGVVIEGRRLTVMGAGEAEVYTCRGLVAAGPVPPAGGKDRIGLIYDVASPNAAFRTATLLVREPEGWSVDEGSIGRYDDTPEAQSLAALTKALGERLR